MSRSGAGGGHVQRHHPGDEQHGGPASTGRPPGQQAHQAAGRDAHQGAEGSQEGDQGQAGPARAQHSGITVHS